MFLLFRIIAPLLLFFIPNSILADPESSNQRISVQKCEEYMEIYREYHESPLLPPFDDVVKGDLMCPTLNEPLIVKGRNAFLDEFPHMVSLQYKRKDGSLYHGCGGTLISNQYVMTAAHCINAEMTPGERKSPEKIILGDISISQNKIRSKRKEMSVASITVHPDYNPAKSSYHDIALIKLSGSLKFDHSTRPAIRPACLGQPGQTMGLKQVTVTGWGKISDNSDTQNLLKAANLTVEENARCQETYSDLVKDSGTRFPEGILPNLLCAGDKYKDTCQGDSGGPLTINPVPYLRCMDYVVGITSIGPSLCGKGIPGIYTRVENYIEFIENIVWKNS